MASFGGQQNQDSSQSPSSGLRQPKEETVSRLLNNHGGGVQLKASGLSVNAPEFIPRIPTGSSNNAQSGYKPVLSASAPVFVPRQQFADVSSQLDYDPVLQEFKQTLMILNRQPGNVEEYMRPLSEKFKHGVTTAEQMAEIIDVLFLQSVTEGNFRYTGARICQQINSSLKDHSVFSTFRNAFLKRCQKEYDKREDLVNNPDTVDSLAGFTLFMGELFLNLEVVKDGRITKMNILPNILKDLLLTLLSQPSRTTVKCSCQLLKLVGSSMEDMMRTKDGSSSPFDEVFELLQCISSSSVVDNNMNFLITSVVNLRQSNWGRPESASSSTDGDHSLNGSIPHELGLNEPVFYDAKGQTITREEAGFYQEDVDESEYILDEEEEQAYLEWQAETNQYYQPDDYSNEAYTNWSNSEDQGYTYYGDDGAMDEEAEAAYDEFLKQSQNQRGYH